MWGDGAVAALGGEDGGAGGLGDCFGCCWSGGCCQLRVKEAVKMLMGGLIVMLAGVDWVVCGWAGAANLRYGSCVRGGISLPILYPSRSYRHRC